MPIRSYSVILAEYIRIVSAKKEEQMLKTIVFSIIVSITMMIAEASTYSCSISRQTVHHVDRCPKTEEEWKEAAERKNCSRYAHHCTEPEKLLYHCVVNPYVNQTLEVCAIRKNMIGGFCSEYSILENVIRSNYNRNCQKFIPNPCPLFYLSNSTFKYPGCYKLKMTPAPVTDSSASSSSSSKTEITETVSTSYSNMTGDGNFDPMQTGLDVIIGSVLAVLVVIFPVLVLVLLLRKKAGNQRSWNRENADLILK
uniref:Uncharacterized protein LOC111099465 n=1 Tax=Crassostrea virginica TaxID=6565 RepID=A0A8B8A4R2_CRAVI|nr:uncharacterized protein LOC111099465 [Crassostrea virginica]